MDRKILSVVLSVLLLFTIFAPPAFAQETEGAQVVFGENFVVEAETTLNRDLVVFGGSVTIENSARVTGDMVVFGGNVNVDGTIEGDVGIIGGNLNLNETAVVEGDVGLVGGAPHIAEGAVIRGQIKSPNNFAYDYDGERAVDDDDQELAMPAAPTPPAAPDAPPSPPRPDTRPDRHFRDFDYDRYDGPSFFGWIGRIVGDIFWTIGLLIILGLITWLVAAFMPEQMFNVRQTVLETAPLSFGLGLITTIVAIVAVPLAVLLLITICLAIVPIAAYIVLGVATLFGWIVVSQIIGERLLIASGRSQPDFILSSLVGVFVLTLLATMPVIGQIPCIGFLLSLLGSIAGFVAAMIGLGAVLLTRFGTRPYPPASDYRYPGAGGGPAAAASPGGGGPRVRWTEPPPDVSEEDAAASEAELNARIKAALAEADRLAQQVREGAAAVSGEPVKKTPAEPETPQADEPDQDQPGPQNAPDPEAEDQPKGEGKPE